MARRQYTDEERQTILKRIEELKAQGKTRNEALKEVNLSSSLYHNWSKGKLKSNKSKKRKSSLRSSTPSVTLSPIPATEEEQDVVVLIGKPSTIATAIKKIYGPSS